MQTLEEKQQDGMTGAGPETEFHTELFGFNRVEVLSYIERISAANAEKARALEDTIAALQKDLTGVRRQGSTLAQKAKQVFNELENQKKRAEDAVAEAAALRTEVDKANDEIAAVRSRLFAREQENAALSYRVTGLENRVFAAIAAQYAGAARVLHFEPGLDSDGVRRLAAAVMERTSGLVAVCSGEDGGYKYCLGQTGGDLRVLTRAWNAALQGRGGGKPFFTQGSVAADRAAIEAFWAAQE